MLCKKPEVSKWSRSLLGSFLVTPYLMRRNKMSHLKTAVEDLFRVILRLFSIVYTS